MEEQILPMAEFKLLAPPKFWPIKLALFSFFIKFSVTPLENIRVQNHVMLLLLKRPLESRITLSDMY